MIKLASENVLGTQLKSCSDDPVTGFYRNGCCDTGPHDLGMHTICAIITREFLDFSFEMGNDLVTPRPEYGFPGLKVGDRWCVCAGRWKEAYDAGAAALVVLESTHKAALDVVSFEELKSKAFSPA